MSATCPNLQKSIGWCQGAPEYPGIRSRVYYQSKGNIVKFPTLQRDSLKRATTATLTGSFELAADEVWHYIDINVEKSKLTSEAQGEAPSQTQLNKLELVHNGVGDDASAAAAYLNNNDNVFVVQDMAGRFRVVGNERWQSKTTVGQDSGQGTSPASTTISAEATDEVAAPFYTGTLETEDGTLDCSTGVIDGDTTTNNDSVSGSETAG